MGDCADRNREFKILPVDDKCMNQLVVAESSLEADAEAVARVMWPAAEEP